jgi:hypothetical protein
MNKSNLETLRKRAGEIKAALKAVQAKQKAQARADDERLKSLIGEALIDDAESAGPETRGGRRAYISEVLDRQTKPPAARAFLKAKGWL